MTPPPDRSNQDPAARLPALKLQRAQLARAIGSDEDFAAESDALAGARDAQREAQKAQLAKLDELIAAA